MSDIQDEIEREIIYDHCSRPRRRGGLGPDAALLENPSCGDVVRLSMSGDSAGGPDTVEFRFEGSGCSISQSSASMMAELLSGRSREEAVRMAETVLSVFRGEADPQALEAYGDVRALAGVARLPVRSKCAALAWRGALELLRKRDTG